MSSGRAAAPIGEDDVEFELSAPPEQRSWRFCRRRNRHFLVGCTASIVAHASSILLFGAIVELRDVWIAPLPQGVASIDLVVSMPSHADFQAEQAAAIELRAVTRSEPDRGSPSRPSPLTPRETQIFRHGSLPPPAPLTAAVESATVATYVQPAPMVRASALAARGQPVRFDDQPRVRRSQLVSSVSSRSSSAAQTDTLPSKITSLSPPPVYPSNMLASGISGSVELRVRVAADGRVTRISTYRTSGYPSFDAAALEAVRRWRFQPARIGGHPVTKEVLVGIDFVLR
jgi:protein TonB